MAHSKWRRRLLRVALVALAAVVVGMGLAWRFWTGRHVAQWQMLRNVVHIERADADKHSVQLLGWNLAILGRDDEVRQMDFHPQFELPPLDVDARKLDLNVVPWRVGFTQIASEHRIIMLMEDQFVSKHREMIGATLPTLRAAGFTHYAAEAIGESAERLKSRG